MYDHMPVGSIVFWHEAQSLQSLKNTYPTDWASKVWDAEIGNGRTVTVPKGWVPCYGNVVNENILAPNLGDTNGVEPYYFATTPYRHTGPDKLNRNYVKLRNTDIPNHYHKVKFETNLEIGSHSHKITGGEHTHYVQTGDDDYGCKSGKNWDAVPINYNVAARFKYVYANKIPTSKGIRIVSADICYDNDTNAIIKGHKHVCEPSSGTQKLTVDGSTLSTINNGIYDGDMQPTTEIDKKPATVYLIPIMKYRNIN